MKQLFVYALCLGGLVGLVLIFRFYRLWTWIRTSAERRYWQTVANIRKTWRSNEKTAIRQLGGLLFRLMTSVGQLSDSVLLVSAFITCSNIVLIYLQRNNPGGIRKTTGLLALLNCAPLFLGGRVSAILSLTGMCQAEYYAIHKLFGTVVLLEGCAHGILALNSQSRVLSNHSLVISTLILFISLSAHSVLVYFFGRRIYEILLKFHLLAAIATIILLRVHVSRDGHESVLLEQACLAMLGLYIIGLVFRGMMIIYRNVSTSAMTKIVLPRKAMLDAVFITVVLPRCVWKARPGQYIYLWFPQLGWRYAFQSHPLYIARSSVSEGQRHTLELLVEQKRGFSARLHDLVRSTETLRTTPIYWGLLEGPYYHDQDVQNTELLKSSKILMFGNGSHALKQLGYLRYLLQNHQSDDLPQKRIIVVWSFEVEQYLDWFEGWVRNIRYKDGAYPDYHIYVYAGQKNSNVTYEMSHLANRNSVFPIGHEVENVTTSANCNLKDNADSELALAEIERVTYMKDSELDVGAYIKKELPYQGRTTIQVCGTGRFNRAVYEASREYVSDRVKYQNSSY